MLENVGESETKLEESLMRIVRGTDASYCEVQATVRFLENEVSRTVAESQNQVRVGSPIVFVLLGET